MSGSGKIIPLIGYLRHRVVIETPVRTSDGAGGADVAWMFLDEVWAQVVPTGGRAIVTGEGRTGLASHTVLMRYHTTLVPAHRLRFGNRIFEITAIIDIDERRRWLKVLCQERDL